MHQQTTTEERLPYKHYQIKIIKMKRISLSGIYGAPTVVTIFGPKNFLYSVHDAFCAEIHSVLSKNFFKNKS